jgi:UDP-N-acetylglucosamine 1-carboxyvinyltransferase
LLEVVSFIGAAVVTRGQVTIRNAGVQHLEMISQVFRRMGVGWQVNGNDLLVPEQQRREIVSDMDGAVPEIKTNVWPAYPTDLISIAITVATQMNGSILFHDWMFSGRMYFTDKLVGMGARIILCDPYRCLVQGPNALYAEKLESPDIRAGMALLLATLAANGQSTIRNVRSTGATSAWMKSCACSERRSSGSTNDNKKARRIAASFFFFVRDRGTSSHLR